MNVQESPIINAATNTPGTTATALPDWSNKRARFDPTGAITPSPPGSPAHSFTSSPVLSAKQTLDCVLGSLPASIKPLAEFYAKKFNRLHRRKLELSSKRTKLESNDFTPQSINFAFVLGASDEVQEKYSSEFTNLRGQAELTLANTIVDLKK